MSVFPDWEQYAVPQRRPRSGCIPTGYEMLVRAAKVSDVDLETFQDEFDLDKDRLPNDQPANNFESVADAIRRKYPHVQFRRIRFPHGCGFDKLKFIEEQITSKKPMLISLSLSPFGGSGWHIMPVVDATENDLILLEHMALDGSKKVIKLSKSDLVRIHDEFEGGNDVAYLDVD